MGISHTHTHPWLLRSADVRTVDFLVRCQILLNLALGERGSLEPGKDYGPWLTVLSFKVGFQAQEDASGNFSK